jgi:hypothetical protein
MQFVWGQSQLVVQARPEAPPVPARPAVPARPEDPVAPDTPPALAVPPGTALPAAPIVPVRVLLSPLQAKSDNAHKPEGRCFNPACPWTTPDSIAATALTFFRRADARRSLRPRRDRCRDLPGSLPTESSERDDFMRRGFSRTVRVVTSGVFLSSILAFGGCSGTAHTDEESVGEVRSAYTDPPEHTPAEWICDLPIEAHYSIYAPNQEEQYLNECYLHTDYDAKVRCNIVTGRPCCMQTTYHSHSVTYSNQSWNCAAYWMGWRHL